MLPVTQAQIDAVKSFTMGSDPVSGVARAPNFYTDTDGNWRVTLPVTDGADAVLITNEDPPVSTYRNLFVAFLVLFLLAVVSLCVTCYMYASAKAW